mmetsp:Transcript_45819/g.97753  ORF Transcript_45819/g.97753 Transcript_45819/m.97753 type:complete len:217 (+) Transcript_45819:159-809(+)
MRSASAAPLRRSSGRMIVCRSASASSRRTGDRRVALARRQSSTPELTSTPTLQSMRLSRSLPPRTGRWRSSTATCGWAWRGSAPSARSAALSMTRAIASNRIAARAACATVGLCTTNRSSTGTKCWFRRSPRSCISSAARSLASSGIMDAACVPSATTTRSAACRTTPPSCAPPTAMARAPTASSEPPPTAAPPPRVGARRLSTLLGSVPTSTECR